MNYPAGKPWLHDGAMCEMRNGGKFEIWKIINGNIIGFNHESNVVGKWLLNERFGICEHPEDLIGPWKEPLKLEILTPSYFEDCVKYIAADSNGMWYVYKNMPKRDDTEWYSSGINFYTLLVIKMPQFPLNRWRETLHRADRENNVWVKVNKEE